ncbi:MAG: hypothetical protein ABI772_00265 [Bacteroidota bacterium]
MPSRKLMFTFDYELFLGRRSGTVHDCMVDPTNRLLEIFRNQQVSAIFFVDTTYLLRVKEYCNNHPGCKKDFNNISAQLKQMVRDGHHVYPHIHPHWLDAVYLPEINEWELTSVERYRFHNITEAERELVFKGSIDVLNEILLPEFPDYHIDGFRAGGWSLQPFSDFKPYFKKFGIHYDFSVLPGTYQFSNAQHFDFTVAPQKPVYRFEDDVNIENVNGDFIELVSSILHVSPTINFLHKMHLHWLHRVKGDHTYGKGQGQRSQENPSLKPADSTGSSIHNPQHQPVSIETMSMVKFGVYRRYLSSHSYMQFVSHPKMLSLHNMRTLNRFLTFAKWKYQLDYNFKSFINSANELY